MYKWEIYIKDRAKRKVPESIIRKAFQSLEETPFDKLNKDIPKRIIIDNHKIFITYQFRMFKDRKVIIVKEARFLRR
jgi:hypothetical protein